MNNTLFVITGFITSFVVVWLLSLIGEPRSVWMMERIVQMF